MFGINRGQPPTHINKLFDEGFEDEDFVTVEGKDFQKSTPTPSSYKTYDLTSMIGGGNQLQINDGRYPEYEPYHFEMLQTQVTKNNYLDKLQNILPATLKDATYIAKGLANMARTVFYETNFELLLSLVDENRVIRATKNPLFVSDGLYSLSKFAPKVWFTNFFKQTCLEGFFSGRWDAGNAAKIAEFTPRILLNKAKEIHADFDQKQFNLARKSAAILSDSQFDNEKYLTKMVKDLENQLTKYKSDAIQLELSDIGAGKTAMKKVQLALDELLEKTLSSISPFSSRQYYKVDELKIFLHEFFNKLDHFSGSIRESYVKMLLQSKNFVENNKVDCLRHKIHELTQELHLISEKTTQQIEQLSILLDDFETRRA